MTTTKKSVKNPVIGKITLTEVQKPTIGRIVIYNTTKDDRSQLGPFNNSNVSDKLPAIVVAVWDNECVNLKVIVDGSIPDIWKTSVCQGKKEGDWDWPLKK